MGILTKVIQALRRLTNTVYLCLDGDQARRWRRSTTSGLYIIILPEGHSMDEIYCIIQGFAGIKIAVV